MPEYQWHMDEVATAANGEYPAGTIIEQHEYDAYADIFEAFMNGLPPEGVKRDVYLRLTDDDGIEYTARPAGPRLEGFFRDEDGENGPMVPMQYQNEMKSII